jgi:biopolymer transport protein ExbD
MAVMKKKRKGGIPPISTASLPDVIFMILFFFMISTSMRDMEVMVKTQLPNATEVSKLEKKQLVSFIYIGQPVDSQQGQFGTAARIQLNDSYRDAKFIGEFVASEREKLSEADRQAMTIMLKADKGTRMGIIADVKKELRLANALKISYAANKSMAIGN